MSIVLSDMPGMELGSSLKAYREAANALYEQVDSDQAYEDVMNGVAYLDERGCVVYYPPE